MIKIQNLAAVALCALSPYAFAATPVCAQILVRERPAVPAGGKVVIGQPVTIKQNAAAKSEHKIDEKAKAIYDKAVAALKAAKVIEFTGLMKVGNDDPAAQVMMPMGSDGKSRYTVRFVDAKPDAAPAAAESRFPPLPTDSIRVESLDGPSKGSVLVIHGGKVLQFNADKKTYNEGGDQPALVALISMQSFPGWVRSLRGTSSGFPGSQESEPLSIELAGTVLVDELECDLIKIEREVEINMGAMPNEMMGGAMKLSIHETLAIARVDGLPREQTTKPEFDAPEGAMVGGPGEGGGEVGDEEGDGEGAEEGDGEGDADGGGSMQMLAPAMTFTVFGLKVDPKTDDATFSLKAPEGFTKADPEMPGMMMGGDEGEAPQPPALAVKAGDPAPDFKLMTLDGKEVTLASLKGKVVLLDFWATWCGPCKAAMPTIQKISEDYKSKDVVVLGVNTFEQKPDAAKDYLAKKKFTYGCLLKGDELAKAYGVTGIPTLVIIGKDGKVASTEVGMSDESGAMIRKAIDAALAK